MIRPIWCIDIDISGDNRLSYDSVQVYRGNRARLYEKPTRASLIRCQRAQLALYDRAEAGR